MKKSVVLLTFVALLVAAYLGTTYWLSAKAAAHHNDFTPQIIGALPYLKVATNEYQRGIFKSTHLLGFELPGGAKTGTITLRSVIKHGPLPGFTSVGTANIEHTLLFDGPAGEEIKKVFGEQPPVSATTNIALNGSGTVTIKGAPANFQDQGGKGSWQGFTGNMKFSKNLADYTVDMAVPGLVIDAKDTLSFKLNNLAVKATQTKVPNTETVYTGPMSMSLESMAASTEGKPAFDVKKISVTSDSSIKDGQFIDLAVRFLIAEFQIGEHKGSNAEYALSMKHLHAPSLDEINKVVRTLQQQQAGGVNNPQANAVALLGLLPVVKKHGLTLLQQQPVFAIDRIGYQTSEGSADFSGTVQLLNVAESDIDNPMALIGKIDARAKIGISNALLHKIFTSVTLSGLQKKSPAADQAEIDKAMAIAEMGFDQSFARLQEHGYVQSDQDRLSSNLVFKAGQFTINDKIFDPTVMAPSPPPAAKMPSRPRRS